MAAAFKDKGNEAFKAGDYASAIGFYTSAILADPKDTTYPLNRAAAYLKLNKFQDAQRDCSKALSIDPRNIKALFRRGQANAGLGNYAAAKKDLEQVVAREPGNQVAKQELSKVQERLSSEQKALRRVPKEVQPAAPPLRRRIPIKIIDDESSPSVDIANVSENTPKAKPLIEVISSTATETPNTNKPPPKSFQQAKEVRLTKTSKIVGGGIFKRNGSHPESIFEGRPLAEPAVTEDKIPSVSIVQTSSPLNTLTQELPVEPTNSFEFQRRWRSSSNSVEKWALLRAVPPEKLANFFKTSLEPDLLASMVNTLHSTLQQTPADKPLIQKYVDDLTRIPRFDSVTLFLSTVEKEEAKSLFRRLDHPVTWKI